jgi:hypothetical protein
MSTMFGRFSAARAGPHVMAVTAANAVIQRFHNRDRLIRHLLGP